MAPRFIVLGGHILLGLAVFGIGLYLANLAHRLIRESNVKGCMVYCKQ